MNTEDHITAACERLPEADYAISELTLDELEIVAGGSGRPNWSDP